MHQGRCRRESYREWNSGNTVPARKREICNDPRLRARYGERDGSEGRIRNKSADSLRFGRSVKGMGDGFWDTNLRGELRMPGPNLILG